MTNNQVDMKKGIALIRVSTEHQDLSQQTDAVIREMKQAGYADSDIITIEDKESAVKLNEEARLGLTKMKEHIQSDPSIDCVYVYELSRLSRRPDVLYSIRDWLVSRGIQLIVLKPYMRLLDDTGKISESAAVIFAIFAALAEQEGYIRKERLARGRQKAQASGRYVGGNLPLGYTINDEHKIAVDREAAQIVVKMFEDYASGKKSSMVIAKELYLAGIIKSVSIESASVIVRMMLKDVAYIGGQPQYSKFENGHKSKGPKKQSGNIYPRIISDELFYAAQKQREIARSAPKTTHKHTYYCKGILRDAVTGRAMMAQFTIASYTHAYTDESGRHSLVIPINIVDSLAWHLAQQHYLINWQSESESRKEEVKRKYRELQPQLKNVSSLIENLDVQEYKLQDRIIRGKLDESMGDKMLEEIAAKKAKLDNERARLQEESDRLQSFILKHAGRQVEPADYSSVEDDAERAKLIAACITRIDLIKYDKDAKRKRGAPVGELRVTFVNGLTDVYYYHNYTRKIWDSNMQPIEYKYLERFYGKLARRRLNSRLLNSLDSE